MEGIHNSSQAGSIRAWKYIVVLAEYLYITFIVKLSVRL